MEEAVVRAAQNVAVTAVPLRVARQAVTQLKQ